VTHDAPIEVRVEASRCVLCGGPNDCALARPGAASSDAPCWCVDRVFPARLSERASERDGGASCICRRCLDAEAGADAGDRLVGSASGDDEAGSPDD
jgi:hypothetical protein